MSQTLLLDSVDATRRFGRAVGEHAREGDLLSLVGDFGAGKTTLTRGIALGLGVDPATRVVSPTFVLLCIYAGRIPLFHYDIQRLPDASEVYDLDWDTASQGVVVVEWGDRAAGFKGLDHLELRMCSGDPPESRRLDWVVHGDRSKTWMDDVLQSFARTGPETESR